ncbi:MAG: GH116 family glycosyl-hydrolase [Planctomycetota bacterium]
MRKFLRVTLSIVLTMIIISNGCKSSPFLLLQESRGGTLDTETIMKRLAEGSNGVTPTEKKFDINWVRSLTERVESYLYTKENSSNFEYIGMPVGGIATGQIFLGGDGKLWYWDIFNNKSREHVRGVRTYADPYKRSNLRNRACNNVEQGFAIQISSAGKTQMRTLDSDGFSDIKFSGQYPIATVTYSDDDSPVSVKLEAFSPFVPLDVESSTYPATVLNYTIVNNSKVPVTGKITGWLENAVCLDTRSQTFGRLRNQIVRYREMTLLFCDVMKHITPVPAQKDIIYEDFEGRTLDKWAIEGEAFSGVPKPNYHHQPLQNHQGKGLADSFFNNGTKASAQDSDSPKGKMTSQPFTIQRSMIKFLIGGGKHGGQTCLNLVIDGRVVRTATGKNSERLNWEIFDVSKYIGKKAKIEVVDAHSGGWGHIMVDQIVFTDKKVVGSDDIDFNKKKDYGSMALVLVDEGGEDTFASADTNLPDEVFAHQRYSSGRSFDDEKLIGSVGTKFVLRPGEETTVSYVLAWYFPNLYLREFRGRNLGRSYGERFSSASDVVEEIGSNYERLARQTRLWRNTWYDSTLPYWFLDRTFLNSSILATNTCYLFRNGRFYGYEGVYCCAGTCTHVWAYVQAMGRLFPELERRLRERVDYNPEIAFNSESGKIGYRGELNRGDAVDGHSGVILRTYREHQMSENDAFLRRNYNAVTKAMNYLIKTYDADEDGILTGGQHNTLDARWYGKITWLSLYYGAALRAAGEMADEMGDREYSRYVRTLAERGRKYIEEKLFNGEYFIHETDPAHPKSPGVFNGCEYSQLLGQSWAYQVGLGEILDREKVTTALNSLWKYNFSTDVGPFREVFKNGRWYAMPGEGGLIACTWPHGGKEALTHGSRHFAGYLNECQNGYEYGATSLMMWHGMVYRALAHTRTLHDRYHASKRNPWNEIECGDHYARSMASYGLFTAVSGFENHGPKGYIAFSPRLMPENFKAAFTSAAGWGTFIQKIKGHTQTEILELKYGHLRLQTLGFDLPDKKSLTGVAVKVAGKKLNAKHSSKGRRVIINLERNVNIKAGQSIEIRMTF